MIAFSIALGGAFCLSKTLANQLMIANGLGAAGIDPDDKCSGLFSLLAVAS